MAVDVKTVRVGNLFVTVVKKSARDVSLCF